MEDIAIRIGEYCMGDLQKLAAVCKDFAAAAARIRSGYSLTCKIRRCNVTVLVGFQQVKRPLHDDVSFQGEYKGRVIFAGFFMICTYFQRVYCGFDGEDPTGKISRLARGTFDGTTRAVVRFLRGLDAHDCEACIVVDSRVEKHIRFPYAISLLERSIGCI